MKTIKMSNSSVKDCYSGVYKINFPNGKVYIGISNNIYRRMLEHNTDFRNNLPIEHAIKKYGKITEFDILEIIEPQNRQLMREREKYWISQYHSNEKEKGYNISKGGDGADIGSSNHEARFTEEELLSLYKELKEELNISMTDLAKKYGIHLSTLSNINNGKTYYHSSIEYPIRNSKEQAKVISGTKNSNSYLSEEQLNVIIDLLKNRQDLTMREIAKITKTSSTIVQNINKGIRYKQENEKYPLRKPKTGVKKLTQEQVLNIINEIKNSDKSLVEISKEFGVSSKSISSINCGTTYKQQNEKYPIRIKH